MSEVYLYDADCNDFDSIGIVGALVPTRCVFSEAANGNSSLSLTHPMDDLGRYKQLKSGMILKTAVPVRTVPEILNGEYIDVVTIYTVKNTATKLNRYIYNRAKPDSKKDKKLKLVPVGGVVTILATYTDESKRWKCSYKYKSGKKWKTVTGYIDHDSNTIGYQESREVAPTPTGQEAVAPSWATKDQLFRIYSVEKGMNDVTVEAQHISYDLMYNLTTYNENGSKTAQEALTGVLDHCLDEDHGFTVQTNLRGSKAGYHYQDKDPITALLDPENGIVTRFGGQLIRDNYSLSVLDQAGANRGMRIEYGKNLQSVGYSMDMSNMATAIRPVGEYEDGSSLHLNKSYVVSLDGSTVEEIPGDTKGIVYAEGYDRMPFQRIFSLACDDATENKKNGPSAATVRNRLLEQAKAAIAGGSAVPEVSVTVDMVSIADSVEYAAYADLEKYFLFDTVRVFYPPMDIDIETTISEIEYDLIEDRMTSITFGTLRDMQPSIASWQISSVSGTKLIPGTIGAGALAENTINERHIQVESINTDALQANTITSKHISTAGLNAEVIKTGTLDAERIDAGAVAAQVVAAENFKAQTAEIVRAQIRDVDIDYAHIKDSHQDNVFVEDGMADYYYIDKLRVRAAQVMEMIVGSLVFRDAESGKLYQMRVGKDESGEMALRPVEVPAEKIVYDADGNPVATTDGQVVSRESIEIGEFSESRPEMVYAKVMELHADQLFANEAFVHRLTTGAIFADGGTLTIVAQDSKEAKTVAEGADRVATIANDAAANAQSKAEEVDNKAKKISEDLERRVRINAQGLHVGDSRNTTEVMIDTNTVNIGRVIPAASEDEQDGFEAYSQFASNYARFGNYEIRQSSGDGGLVFKLVPKGVV